MRQCDRDARGGAVGRVRKKIEELRGKVQRDLSVAGACLLAALRPETDDDSQHELAVVGSELLARGLLDLAVLRKSMTT